jgi:hypothetical protein
MHTAKDVLPQDSGPNISTTLPRAIPPPSTESSVKHPVDILSLQVTHDLKIEKSCRQGGSLGVWLLHQADREGSPRTCHLHTFWSPTKRSNWGPSPLRFASRFRPQLPAPMPCWTCALSAKHDDDAHIDCNCCYRGRNSQTFFCAASLDCLSLSCAALVPMPVGSGGGTDEPLALSASFRDKLRIFRDLSTPPAIVCTGCIRSLTLLTGVAKVCMHRRAGNARACLAHAASGRRAPRTMLKLQRWMKGTKRGGAKLADDAGTKLPFASKCNILEFMRSLADANRCSPHLSWPCSLLRTLFTRLESASNRSRKLDFERGHGWYQCSVR